MGRKRAIHYGMGLVDHVIRGMCGLPIVRYELRPDGNRWPNRVKSRQCTSHHAYVTCVHCKRLLRMSEADRMRETMARKAANKPRLDALRTKSDAARAEKRAAMLKIIEQARGDAHVALDCYITGRPYKAHAAGAISAPTFGELLDLARADHSIRARGRGDRLWVFGPAAKTQSIPFRSHRPILCRFCRATLGHGFLGVDYTDHVSEHVIQCALRYLAGLALPEADTSIVMH